MNDYSKLNKVSLEIRNQVEEREHFHQDIELIYVLDGAMTVEVGNQKSELKAEDILVINANKKHWLRTNDKDILYLRLGIAYQLVSDGSYGMICHNMRKLSYNYYFTKEDELEKDQMWKYIENQKQLNLKVELDDLESGEYQQKIYRINSDNGNVLGIWGEMGYIRDMDREDVKYFRRVCEPKMLIDNMNVVRHQMEINLTLEPNEITFVRIRKIG